MEMLLAAEEQRLQSLAQLLVQEKLIDKTTALEYQNQAAANKQSLLRYLVSNHLFSAQKLAFITAQNFCLPLFDLDNLDFDSIPIQLVNEKLISRYAFLPLFIDAEHLVLATEDPSQQEALKEIQFHTGMPIKLFVVETNKLQLLIDKVLHRKVQQGLVDYLEDSVEEKQVTYLNYIANEDDTPVVKFVNKVLLEAIKKGCSDIHFESYEQEYRIRYRQNGLLIEVAKPPLSLANRIAARIKIMAKLDISERRIPQDGRFKMTLSSSHSIDFRVNTCPTVDGEKVVIRLLDPESIKLDIETLGFNSLQKQLFLSSIEKSQGMILVTGPTGSGKTVSLYTALNLLNTKERNISTAEDPVEIKLSGINQVNINPKAGLSFSKILRSFLRQDPDIIMVGEIRDLETADLAVKAAQTGHLVLSTLHTNSAAETITRLINMGIPSFNIASSLSLLIAQRLARRLCDFCKTPRYDLPSKALRELGFNEEEANSTQLYKANGCNHCSEGYQGRIGLFEVMPISKEISQSIMSGANSLELLKQAQAEGMLTIYQSGLEKIKAGLTTIEEVNRVSID